MPMQQSRPQQSQQYSFFSEPMQSSPIQQLKFGNQLSFSAPMHPGKPGPQLAQTFVHDSFPPSAPNQQPPVLPQALSSGTFPPSAMQRGPQLPQTFVSGTLPPTAMQAGLLPPQTFANGPFPAGPAQFSPLMPQAVSNGSFPPIPMQPGPMPPHTFSSGPFSPTSMQPPVLPQALNSGMFPPTAMPASPLIPHTLNSGPFPNSSNGPMAFRAATEPVQQHSPAGVVRSASVIQHNKTFSLRRVLVAIGVGFIIALTVVVGYLALQQKPVTQQDATPVKQIVQTHPKPLPTLAPITTGDPRALYAQATTRPAISDDPLRAQSDNDWESINSPGSCTFDANTLHAVNTSPDSRVTMCLANATKYKNIAFQAQLTAIQGDTYGLVVRSDSKGHQLYLFSISTTGTYTLAVSNGQNGTQAHVLTAGISPDIKQGQNQSNQLTIITRDNTLYVYINQKFVAKVDDTTTTNGSIGLFVGNSQGDVSEARFSKVKVWSV
ncbi:MAG: hypothetical protein NVS2B12_03560 [Ktedonobacteraceae bacterium]